MNSVSPLVLLSFFEKSLNQRRRNASARYTHVYLNAVHKLREKKFAEDKKGVPLEYFDWERIIVDEIHVRHQTFAVEYNWDVF